MAKGQHLSSHQRAIVNRYYAHLDTITLTKLAEIVSDLYVAASPSAADKLWKRAHTALAKTSAADARVAAILQSRDVKALAQLVNDLSAPGR